MNITRENIDNVNFTLKILIEKADYDEAVQGALKEYRQKAAIPGFRPGKVPAGLIQKRFGKAILADEVNKLLSHNLSKYIVEEKLPILGEPLPNETIQKTIDWDNDENYEFVFDLAIAPEINIPLSKTDNFDYFLIKVTDEMIDKDVEALTYQFGQNIPAGEVSEKSNVRGNFAQLGSDGNLIPDGIRPEGVMLAADMIKDETIKAAFLGKKAGDTLVFDPVIAFGNRHEVGHMLNIEHEQADNLNSEFEFTITEISNYQPSEVNEELFKKVYGEESGITTAEQFRDKVKSEIAQNLAFSSDYKFAADARDTLVEKTPMELPEVFLKRWLKLANKELTDEQIDADFGGFIQDLKWQLIKDKIAKENEIKISEEEAMDFARQITLSRFSQYGMYHIPDEQLNSFAKMMLEKEEEKDRIYKKLAEDKVIAVVKEKVNLVEKEVAQEEFNAMVK